MLTASSLANYSTPATNDNTYATIVSPSFSSGTNTVSLNYTQLSINNQISAFIRSGANTVQFAMGATGFAMQYGSATGIFVNSTYIEVNGPTTLDSVTTFKMVSNPLMLQP